MICLNAVHAFGNIFTCNGPLSKYENSAWFQGPGPKQRTMKLMLIIYRIRCNSFLLFLSAGPDNSQLEFCISKVHYFFIFWLFHYTGYYSSILGQSNDYNGFGCIKPQLNVITLLYNISNISWINRVSFSMRS